MSLILHVLTKVLPGVDHSMIILPELLKGQLILEILDRIVSS